MTLVAELALAFGALFAVGLAAARLGHSVVPAFILVGMLLGPAGVGLVGREAWLQPLASIGLLLLLFFMGLEFSLSRLARGGRRLAVDGVLNFALNFPAGFAAGLLFGWDLLSAVFLGLVVYVTSSGIMVKALIELRRIANPETETALGVSVTEDICAAMFLALVASVASVGTADPLRLLVSVGATLAFCAAFLAIARLGGPWLHKVLGLRSEELFLLLVVALLFASAALGESVGLSPAVSAFFLGMAFADAAQSGRIKAKVVPLRDALVGLFFFSFGMWIDLSALPRVAWMLALLVPITLATKFFTGLVVGELHGYPARSRINIATALLPRGEFSIVAAGIAVGYGLNPAISTFAGFYVVITAVLGTVLMASSGQLAARAPKPSLGAKWKLLPTRIAGVARSQAHLTTKLKP